MLVGHCRGLQARANECVLGGDERLGPIKAPRGRPGKVLASHGNAVQEPVQDLGAFIHMLFFGGRDFPDWQRGSRRTASRCARESQKRPLQAREESGTCPGKARELRGSSRCAFAARAPLPAFPPGSLLGKKSRVFGLHAAGMSLLHTNESEGEKSP